MIIPPDWLVTAIPSTFGMTVGVVICCFKSWVFCKCPTMCRSAPSSLTRFGTFRPAITSFWILFRSKFVAATFHMIFVPIKGFGITIPLGIFLLRLLMSLRDLRAFLSIGGVRFGLKLSRLLNRLRSGGCCIIG